MTASNCQTWKGCLKEVEQLITARRRNAFKITELLCRVFRDDGYRDDCREKGVGFSEKLDDLAQDLGYSFAVLHAAIVEFPDDADWTKRPLHDVIAESQQIINERRRLAEGLPEKGSRGEYRTAKQIQRDLDIANAKLLQAEADRQAAIAQEEATRMELAEWAKVAAVPITLPVESPEVWVDVKQHAAVPTLAKTVIAAVELHAKYYEVTAEDYDIAITALKKARNKASKRQATPV